MVEQSSPQASGSREAVSPKRQELDRGVQIAVLSALHWGVMHWLLIINSVGFVIVALPTVVAPAFLAWGWHAPAELIFMAYSSLCHQMPSRSFFPFGEPMAFCHRMLAIHAGFFIAGMVYILFRRRLKSLPTWLAVVYSLPMAVDGFTQLFGWRESTWELRLATGGFFGLAVVWYVFPHLELLMGILARQLKDQMSALIKQRCSPSRGGASLLLGVDRILEAATKP